ncbi:MAG TPA: outer membrane beta-barrel family protein [Flavisolibacter sp.]|nr:outer membrane beta-barrel family protein [Flavisolibacter sp.]
MRLFLFFFLLSATTSLYAQSILSGRIYNQYHEAVPFASISLKNIESHYNIQIQTDSAGAFSFYDLMNGKYTILVMHTGYESYVMDFLLGRDSLLNIQLLQNSHVLSKVTVTGTKNSIEQKADKLVYNISSSVTATGSDALLAIGQIPGVRLNGEQISVTGKGEIRVMINGRLLELQGEDLIRYLKTISTNQIQRIELMTNPSARYEVAGNAGLINIITRHSKLAGWSGNIQLASRYYAYGISSAYGEHTFGELNGSANITYNINRLSLYGSINHVRDQHLEGFQFDLFYPQQHWLQTDTGLYTHNAYTGMAGVDYKLNTAVVIGASFSGGWDMYDGSDNVRNPIYNHTGALDSLLHTYAHYHPIAQPASLNVYANVKLDTSGKQLTVNADYFNYYRNDVSNFESNSFDGAGSQKPEGTSRYFDRNKQNILVYTLKADVDLPTTFATWSFGGKLSFINEYSNAFYYNKAANGDLTYNTGLSNEFNYTENIQALYGSFNKELNKWKLELGLRGELTQTKGYSYTVQKMTVNNYLKVFPTFLASYAANPDNIFSLSFGRRINRPSFWNLNPFKSLYTAYSYGEGNPYLQPEYSNNLELSHSYKNLLKTSLFASKTDNGFVNVTIPNPDTNLVYTIPLNFIRTLRTGLSENLSLKPFPWWESNLLMSVYYTRAQSSFSYIKSVEGPGANISTNNTLFFNPNKTLAAAVNFWYQFPEVDHIGRSDRYYKLDIGLKATTVNKKWDAALNLNDAFRSSALAYTYTVNNVSQKFTNFQIIRYWQLSITWHFGRSAVSNTRSSGDEEEKGRVY